MKNKISKEEKEWLDNPTISFNMVNGKLEIVGNPFDKKEKNEKEKRVNENGKNTK